MNRGLDGALEQILLHSKDDLKIRTSGVCVGQSMQKSLLPRQRIELLRLELDVKQAERAMLKVEMKHGNKSPIYAVAERQRDEIVARIQRLTGTLATAKNGTKSAGDHVATMLVKSKRNIARDF